VYTTRTRHDPWLVTHGLRVRVDAGTGTGRPENTHGLPVPLPTGQANAAALGVESRAAHGI
jgi:hypothetical protein